MMDGSLSKARIPNLEVEKMAKTMVRVARMVEKEERVVPGEVPLALGVELLAHLDHPKQVERMEFQETEPRVERVVRHLD